MKTRKVWLIILGIFLIVFCYEEIGVSKELYSDYNEINWKEDAEVEFNKLSVEEKENFENIDNFIEYNKKQSFVFMIFSGVVLTFIFAFFKHFFLWLFMIGIYLGIKKYYKNKLSVDDFNKNIEYYRETLKDYSVDLLLYIDNFKINYPNVLISMLLQLKLKGIINIYDDKIHVNKDINFNDLSSNEKYILNNIIDNKLVIHNYNEYNQLIFEEGLKRDLLVKKDTSNNLFSVSNVIYLFVLLCYLLFITNNFSISTTSDGFSFISTSSFELPFIFSMFIMVFEFVTPIFLVSYPIINRIKTTIYNNSIQNEPYFRTKKAEDINKKLEGLKLFLKDFSILDERESKEIMLWDEYLIYSVLFGHNNKIIDEYKDLIIN